ncbi:DNA cytosine methyltransferase [Phenylobacterium sp.]|uniref:DNA cytosine methyltransferase n=1 Tax=Phenylobacterium sp. TaxID=1871053 RepID=UPI0027318810|nr:DNA cytosine methyltransferase [Phenylobacterium sp.]MDP1874831.1 DNA cytosine methyltransferase [Phenylobacterium sp.]
MDHTRRARITIPGRRPVIADLFAGAGGFSLGAYMAGADIGVAVENNRNAAETYRRNLVQSRLTSARLFDEDILDLDPSDLMRQTGIDPGDCDILLGGPPCQGFSAHRLNDAGVGDPRNRLLLRYFEYVRALRPAFFLVENVPGLLWPRHKDFVETFYATADAADYGTFQPILLNACDYGVPQNRRRVFILGYDRRRTDAPTWPPAPTHQAPSLTPTGATWKTAAEIFATPAPRGDINDVHMNHGATLLEAFARTPPNGGSRKDSGRVLPCHAEHRGHHDVYGRIDPARPGPTMTTACINPSKGRFVHPTEHHGITLRHAARFQTFPDWYTFEGGLMAGGVQVGNAVPVDMARVLVEPLVQAALELRAAETVARDGTYG